MRLSIQFAELKSFHAYDAFSSYEVSISYNLNFIYFASI